MPLKPSDGVLPGSERAYDQVDDRLWRGIVKDPRLPAERPSRLASATRKRPGAVPLGLPSGTRYVDAICESFAERDRVEKIKALSRTVTALQADHDAKVARLEAEIERLQGELKKAGK